MGIEGRPVAAADDAAVERAAVQRRTMVVLMVAQLCAGAGIAAGVTVGALLAAELLGSTGLAGVPSALFTGGSAATAVLLGRLSHRGGRRIGLAVGYATGALGAVGVVVAAVSGNVLLLLVSLAVYGAGTATNLQARYAGADLADPDHRGRAVSRVLVATTIGAVAGPNLVEVMGDFAEGLDIPRLAGPFILAAAAYGAAGAVIALWLRPDPLVTARRLGTTAPAAAVDRAAPAATRDAAADLATVRTGAAAMVLTQAVMVGVMTMTPIHLRAHGHGLGDVGLVIALHVAAMYLPSPVTGGLTDRYGRRPVLVAAGANLVAAGVVAAAAPPSSVPALAVALVLLGLGWNLGLVAGTALVTDATPVATRARTQGTVDLSVALSGAAGGLSSGAVVAVSTYPTLALAGAALALLLVPLALRTPSTRVATA